MKFIPNLGLYIHIPWCIKKCSYCDFNTYKFINNKNTQTKYIFQLLQDLIIEKKNIQNRKINTIFIGGGTPSLLKYQTLKYLIYNIKNIVSVDKNAEITIEINPEIINIEKILKYNEIGINRISIGIQSFNNKILKILNRNHSKIHAIKILKKIKNYTNINMNIDLMYGLPNQTLKNCLSDLKQAIAINPEHISWYQLNIEKNTIFHYQKPNLPNQDILWKMYTMGKKILNNSKFIRYEISSYKKFDFPCYHNLNYWKFGDYIGIGCGAHGKITLTNGNIIRTIKKTRIYDYMNNDKEYTKKTYTISNKNKPFEYFINKFRLFKPIKKQDFILRTGIKINNIQSKIKKAIFKKYITEDKKNWYVSSHGKNFLNNLIQLFI